MSSSTFPLVIRREIAIVISLSLGASVFAQPPHQTQPSKESTALRAIDSSTDEADALKQGSHRSFMLTRKQSVIQCMELVREAFRRKDYLAAIPLMERVLSEPNSFVPADASTEIAAHEEIRRFVMQMPPDLRKRIDEQRRVGANHAWELASSCGVDEVISFIRQFGDLHVGVDAWWWLGNRERDHGRRRLAAEAFFRMADHPNATHLQRAVALISSFEMLTDGQSMLEASLVRDRLTKLDTNLRFTIENRTVSLGQWLADNRLNLTEQAAPELPVSSNLVRARMRRPVALPIWKHQFAVTLGASRIVQEQKQRDLGVRPVPISRPMIIGDHVIVRKLEAIYAYHLETGASQWTQSNTEFGEIEGMGLFDRPANQVPAIEWTQRRTQADSIFGRMSSDGRCVFAVQEPDRIREFGIDRQSARTGFRIGPRFNKLGAYSLVDGKPEWEIGGNLAEATYSYRDCFFLGCPFAMDGTLYVVAQRETEVQLLAIEPKNGSLSWSLTLGNVVLPVSEDMQRSRVACPIIWNDGLLLVSTGAGAVVAVDPMLRSLVWGYRYPARTISSGDLLQGQNPAEIRQVQESWWDSWREPFLEASQLHSANGVAPGEPNAKPVQRSILVFTSPETDQLHAVRLPGGEPLWRVSRNGGLMIAGIVNDRVIVIEGDFARAHDLETGRQLWRTATGEVSGICAVTGSIMVLPLQAGGTMLLDARTGQLMSDSTASDAPLGALVEADRGWIADSRQQIMWLPRLSDVRENVEQALRRQPEDESLRVQAAFLDLQAGNFDSVRGHLEGLQSTPARELRRQALVDALRDFEVNRSNADRSDLAKQLKELAEDSDYKFAAAAAIGSAALSVMDCVAVVNAVLDGLSSDLDQSEGLVKMASVGVRKDRVLLGLIDEAYRRVKPGDRPSLDELFTSRLREARKNKDRFAVSQLAQLWKGLDWGRQLVVNDENKILRKRPLREAELQLLDAVGSDDKAVAIQALDTLAARFDRSNSPVDAWAIRQRIKTEFPTVHVTEQSKKLEHLPEMFERNDTSSKRPKTLWPETVPRLEPIEDRHFSVYNQIPMHAEPGSLAEQLDVWIERKGNEVLFRGESFFQSGQSENQERKLTLPATQSTYRGSIGKMLREGWGIGRIVILLVGSELFGILPLNDQGEPNSQLLWTIEIGPIPNDTKVVKGRPGINDGYDILVDQSNRQIGKVGPVRAGYFCFQKGAKLVAAETETGRTLWERLDLPADATILGDDHYVYLLREGNVLEVLSAIDGRKIEDRARNAPHGSLIHHRGSLIWTVTRGDDVRLELNDLKTEELIWSRTDPTNTQIAVVDPESLAIVTPSGQLHLLEGRTGNPLSSPITVNVKAMSGIVAWNDADRWYVAVSRPFEDSSALKSAQWYDSYRQQFVRGTLFALDRHVPRILWERELIDEPIALDQSKASPVMVQLWRLVSHNKNGVGDVILRVTDKRTGKVLIDKPRDLQPYFLLNPDPQQGIVELRLARETIRIVYAQEPLNEAPADALEAIQQIRDRNSPK